ncbi:zinc-dependent alcohol dehydrogenase family protein [Kribbella ginsengisoli]|uniref:Zinc-dependent alcohol dehydrogenase family protein n=1 Tax=Kribbella ginsengisoli TaxID=363865 RepID=A0ABP6XGP6_9ACTN
MRAVVLEQFGTPLVLRDVAKPTPGPGEVLVRVVASGVNPLDTKIRAGKAAHAQTHLPAILGLDASGVIEAVGPEAPAASGAGFPVGGVGGPGGPGFAVGDEVFGLVGGVGDQQGTLAEFVAVDARLLARKPAALSFREAAALPLVFITAWEALVDQAKVRAGQRVLIHGGAGGVGQVAIQLAKAMGAEVFATGSPGSRRAIEELGATSIDYTSTTVEEYVVKYTDGAGFDIVFDTVGGEVLDNSFKAARRYGGHVVSALGWGTHSLAPLSFRSGTYSGVFTLHPLLTGEDRAHHGEILREAAALAERGMLRPRLHDGDFTLATIAEAHAVVEQGQAAGKVVVDL